MKLMPVYYAGQMKLLTLEFALIKSSTLTIVFQLLPIKLMFEPPYY